MSLNIPLNEYRARRNALMQKMGADTAAIFIAAKPAYRNGDTEYAYRQNSDFYYLTGFSESAAVLVLLPGAQNPVVLFNQTHDELAEIWTGKRVGIDAAVKDYGIDAAYPIDEIKTKLPELLAEKQAIYYPMGLDASDDADILQWIKQAQKKIRSALPDLIPIQKLLAPMRLIKSPAEIDLMRYAARLSAKAHVSAMEKVSPGMFEYQLAAEYVYEFTLGGARDVAYLPIVGGGKNACILHYTVNNEKLQAGDLVLVDAGCEYQNYCADVSRTFPVSGKFNDEQRAIYNLVLESYRAGLKKIHAGSDWTQVQQATIAVLTAGLVDLKLLQGTVSDLIANNAYKQFFMHGVGHWLGLEVHDVGPYKIDKKPITFEPGMVLTLEPGIYIRPSDATDKKWWNIGVRIEDDILITPKGHEVLSSDAPISADDIEHLMR